MKEINCCIECVFVGKEEYKGSHVWCGHPKAKGLSLPNRFHEIHPDCPIMTYTIVRHVEGEYEENIREYFI